MNGRLSPLGRGHSVPLQDGGASEVIGAILMVGLTVAVAMSLVSVMAFTDFAPREKVRADFTLQASTGADPDWGTGDEHVTIRHKGGAEVPRSNLAIIVDILGQAERYSDRQGNLEHDGQTAFGPQAALTPSTFTIGERWQTPLPPHDDALTIHPGDVIAVEIVAGRGDPRVVWSGTVKATPLPAPAQPPEPSAANSLITANPASVHADGTDESTITVQIRDQHGDPWLQGGDTVCVTTNHGTLASTAGQGACDPGQTQGDDNNDGTYTATLTASQAGTATVTGTLNGATIQDDATVQFSAQPAQPHHAHSTITADSTTATANGSDASTLTVQVRDQFGQPWPQGGDTVCLTTDHGTLSSTTGQGACDPGQTQGDDNNDGTYTATLTAIAEGTATVTGFLNGQAINDDATVTFIAPDAGDPQTSTIDADPTSVQTEASSTLTVTVNDADSQPIGTGGDTVCLTTDHGTLASTAGQGACDPGQTQGDDNNDGTYTATLTASQAGTATVTGTLNGATIQDDASVSFFALTYVNAHTVNRGSVSDFSNMQDDDGLLATLSEGGETQSGVPTTSTFAANVVRANPVVAGQVAWDTPTNAYTNDDQVAQAQLPGSSGEISQIRYGLEDPSGQSEPIDSVVLRADVQVSSGQSGNTNWRLQACLFGGSCSTVSSNFPGQGTRHTISYDVTGLRPGGGSWTWTDIQNLDIILTAHKTTNANRIFDLFWARATVGYSATTTTYAMNIEGDFTSVPSGDQHDLELRYRASGDAFTLETWNPDTQGWVTKSPTLSSTSLTTWTTTLSTAEYADGEPAVRFVDNTPNGETQGTLEIDYLRVRST